MRSYIVYCLFVFLASASNTFSQQVPDTLFTPPLGVPSFASGAGPMVLIDEAHHNFHTADNRFKPFARLLERDGYQVHRNQQAFDAEVLRSAHILVISNALNERNVQDWSLPNPSAFTDSEIAAVRNWVQEGGSLFLIADHMPFPGCSEKLAAAFGFTFYNGFAAKKRGADGPDLFCIDNGRLQADALTRGLDSIYTFTGQAFDIPTGATSLLTLNESFEILLPTVAWEFSKNTPRQEASGKSQGAYLTFSKGKVVVFGEAAMLTAQLAGGRHHMGFNHPKAKNNVTLLRRLMKWLAT